MRRTRSFPPAGWVAREAEESAVRRVCPSLPEWEPVPDRQGSFRLCRVGLFGLAVAGFVCGVSGRRFRFGLEEVFPLVVAGRFMNAADFVEEFAAAAFSLS